jgi:hypothetical protein
MPEAPLNGFEFEMLKEWLKEEKGRFRDEVGSRLMREFGEG